MKASDFVTTSEQKVLASEQLLFTEQTDAVNTGLVDNADKKGISALKDKQIPTGGRTSIGADTSTGRAPRSSSPRRAPSGRLGTVTDRQAESTATQVTGSAAQSRIRMAFIGKQNVRAASGLLVHNTLQDTELEGTDDLYYKSKGARAIYQTIRNRMSKNRVDGLKRGGDALSKKNPLGGLSEKKYRMKPADPTTAKRTAQAAGYVKKRTYQTVAKNAAVGASRAASHTAVTVGIKGVAAGGLKGVAAAFGGLLAPVFGVLLVILFIAVLGGASGSSSQQGNQINLTNLSGVQLEVATALSQAGLGPVQVAAVMGNIQGESGWDPTVGTPDGGYGLFQFTGSSYTAFADWCNANGKQVDSASAQTEYVVARLQGSWSTALHNSGYYGDITEYAGKDVSYASWLSSTDVGLATYAFMTCYERPAASVAKGSLTGTRIPAAQSFYALLTGGAGGLGEDYANADERGKAIANAALTTPSPGPGLCATWVSQVYQKAGLGYPTGNGNSMLAGYATSSDWANIKVGQIVSAQYGSGSDGAIYGHVGIYIGDGKIMDSVSDGQGRGIVRTSSLTDWITENGRGWVVYGWPW